MLSLRPLRVPIAMAVFSVLFARMSVAHAQDVQIGPAPPAHPVAPPPGTDLTIDITAAPPPGAQHLRAPEIGRYASYPGYPGYAQPYDYLPPSTPRDTPQDVARSWSRHLAIGGTVGIGSPLGWLGVWVDVNFSRWIGLTAGVGTGGNFGAALALGANFRPVTLGRWAPYIGSGFSVNFVDGRYSAMPALEVPGSAWWWNVEGGFEFRARTGLLMRFAVGFATLLNTGDFSNRDFGSRYGPDVDRSIGFSPISAADAHDQGEPLAFFFVHYDLGGLFNF